MTTKTDEKAMETALARNAAYGLLAHALRYPDEKMWSELSDRSHWVSWPEALGKIDVTLGDAIRDLQESLFSPDPAQVFELDRVQEQYSALFSHAVKGACPAYELEYGTGEIFRRSAELSDIKGFYSAFGLELAENTHERPDHVSIECEFMSFLAAKEAYAVEHGQTQGLDIVRPAARQFLESHLGQFLPSFARRIREVDEGGFYGAIGGFAAVFIRFDCAAYDVSLGPELLELRPVDEKEEREQTCGPENFGSECPAESQFDE